MNWLIFIFISLFILFDLVYLTPCKPSDSYDNRGDKGCCKICWYRKDCKKFFAGLNKKVCEVD